MRVFAQAQSPLLKNIHEWISSNTFPIPFLRTDPEAPIMRTRSGEVIFIPWWPDCKNGVLFHDWENDTWDQSSPSQEEENILIDVHADGRVVIRPGDDEGVYLFTSIYAANELVELMDFFVRADAEKLHPKKLGQVALSSTIDCVFLAVRGTGLRDAKLLELKGEYLNWMPEKLINFLDAYFVRDPASEDEGPAYWDFRTFLSDAGIELPNSQVDGIQSGDFVLDAACGWRTAGEALSKMDGEFGYAPCLVFRLKDSFSHMYFSDFVRSTAEGRLMTKQLARGWKSIRKALKETFIVAPTNKNDQIAGSVSLRAARSDYLSTIKRLSEIEEPLEEIAASYRKRSKAAKLLYTDFLEDAVAMEHPLPFFIEFPYRRFRKQDDELEKVKAGTRLLTILSKVPLFLLIEELRTCKHDLGNELLAKVGERPASDGVLVDLQKTAAESIKARRINLPVFDQLIELVANSRLLDQMVEARNRWHHEPFDHEKFLEAMTEYSAEYIPLLRSALNDVSFVVPRSMEFVEGQKILIGEDICSAESHFRRRKWKVDLGMEAFPTNSLVAYRSNRSVTVPLGTLITSKLVDRKMLDFGVFDRQSKTGEPVFVFLRPVIEV
jgi:hypothetical protein